MRVSATRRPIHGFGALTTTLLVTPWVRLFEAAKGQQEREQLSLLLVGFLVMRVVCRGPSEPLLETAISQNDCSLEERWIDDLCRHGFLGIVFYCHLAYLCIYTTHIHIHEDTHCFRPIVHLVKRSKCALPLRQQI